MNVVVITLKHVETCLILFPSDGVNVAMGLRHLF